MYRAILSVFSVAMLAALQLTVSTPAQASSGLASFYGNDFAGRATASGETFNPGAYTAASRTLPFGTLVRVSFHGRSVIVRINDRGPFVGGRSIDLSYGAASAIGMVGAGVGAVDMEVVGSGGTQVASSTHHRRGVQVASAAPRHHRVIQVASAKTVTRQIALGMTGHKHHRGVMVAHAKVRHGTTVATGYSTTAEGYAAPADNTDNTDN